MSHKIHFYFGEESFLIEEAVAGLREQYKATHSDEFLKEKFQIDSLNDAVNAMSLLAQDKFIRIKNPFFIFDTLDEKVVKQFKDVLDSVEASGNIVVIYQTEKKIDQRKKMVSWLKKNSNAVEFKAFKDWEQSKVMDWTRDRVSVFGKSIERDALIALEQAAGVNLRLISGELDKLLIYIGDKDAITVADVQAVTVGASPSIYELTENLKVKNQQGVMRAVRKLLDDNESPIMLFALLVSNIRFYLQILSLKQQRMGSQDMGRVLGKNPYYIGKVADDVVSKYTLDELKKVYAHLAKVDVEIKTGRIGPQVGLELALFEVVSEKSYTS